MRHKKKSRRFSRPSQHRKLMFYNLCNSIILHEKVKTTIEKAKEVRRFLEPIITRSKIDTISNRRFIFSKLGNKKVVGKLFSDIGIRFLNRSGGYLRILKCGFRKGDSAKLGIIELV